MKKLINLLLLLTSLIGYLEWGTGNHAFLFQTEYELLFGGKGLQNFLHPFVLLPLLGQVLLLITLFQKKPNKILGVGGIVCLSLIMLMILFIGFMSKNLMIGLSAVPFIICSILFFRVNRKTKL